MKVTGRRVAIGVAVVGVMVIAWAGIAVDETLVERWYLWKLDSTEEEDRALAAEKLGQMKSRRAIPQLVDILQRASRLPGASRAMTIVPDGSPCFLVSRDGRLVLWGAADFRAHFSYQALVRIGLPAAPALLELVDSPDKGNRMAAAIALKEIDPRQYEDIAPVIEWRAARN